MQTLRPPPPDPYEPDWTVPFKYRNATPDNIVRFWLESTFKATGVRPVYNVFAMRQQALNVLSQLDYERVIRILAFMATPFSKYYQYPYAVEKVVEANEELTQLETTKKKKEIYIRDGFIGPVNMNDLSKPRKTIK